MQVEQGAKASELRMVLADRQAIGPDIKIQLCLPERVQPMLDSEVLDPSFEGMYRAVLVMRPKLYLVKQSDKLSTTAALAKDMNRTGWHGCLGGDAEETIVHSDSKVHPFDDHVPAGVQSKAMRVQRLVEGTWLPGKEKSFQGYAFVMNPGGEADLKTALFEAFGFIPRCRDAVTLEEKNMEQTIH